jgi:catechol 2,3-dioxygenase-like lactoylglutathione lyase family enzyme
LAKGNLQEEVAMSRVSVRYIIDDVPAAMRFYTTLLGFTVERDASPAFVASVTPNLASVPGGWNRLHLEVPNIGEEVERLRGAGVSFRMEEIVTGPGGAQIILDDPSGNPVELFQPGH